MNGYRAVAIATLFISTGSAQTIVVGTKNPNIDVPAVQAAVDQGGRVVLMGHFSFDRAPTTPTGATYGLMVTVSKEVAIVGSADDQGGMTTVDGGNIPFWVEARGVAVTIQGLRFARPKSGAIVVVAVTGLTITNCRIEGVEAVFDPLYNAPAATGIYVGTIYPVVPTRGRPGQPENISGNLLIVNNDIDMQGVESEVRPRYLHAEKLELRIPSTGVTAPSALSDGRCKRLRI